MSAMRVMIAGADRTDVVDLATLSVQDAVGERSTARFVVSDLDGTLALQPGQVVELTLDGAAVFGGSIDRIERRRPGVAKPCRVLGVECCDWHQLCDRRIVSEAYQATLAGDIVRDLVTKYLGAEGVTEGAPSTIQDGPQVVEAVFNYVPATNVLDSLAEKAGFAWWIDAGKVLHFVERATYEAPWALDDDDLVNDLVVIDGREGYRNRQYIRAGKDLTDSQVESFKGDGLTRTFVVGFPMATQPTVTVNSAPQTIGIKGAETGCDWYWNKGDPILTQDGAGTPLGAADTLEVTYQGWFDIVVLSTDEAAIDERKVAEGGTGYYEAAEDEPYLGSLDAAIQSANAKLRRYAKLSRTIMFNTFEPGLRPGQLLEVTLSERALVGDFLVESVELAAAGGGLWRWDVKAVGGEAVGGWVQFFKTLATRGQAFVVRENIREDQVLIRLVQTSEEYGWTEATPVSVFACPVASETLYPSTILYPC